MNPRSTATAPGSGSASGFAIRTSSWAVCSAPRFAFAANESGASFVMTRAEGGSSAGRLPGTFAITSSSSTCAASAGSECASSAACPWEMTTALTFTRAPHGRHRR